MNFVELIPQVFYDAIARIVSGFIIIATVIVIWFDGLVLFYKSFTEMFSWPPMMALMALILIAYILAIVVEGICNSIEKIVVFITKRIEHSMKEKQRCTQWSEAWADFCKAFPNCKVMKPDRPTEAIAIDILRLLNPAVGSRIVKLRAEIALCRTLRMGWTVLILILAIHMFISRVLPSLDNKLSLGSGVIFFILLLCIYAVGARCITINDRHLRALYNHWLLIVSPGVPPFANNSSTIVPMLPNVPPALLIPMNAVQNDPILKNKDCGYRKIVVTEVYEDVEELTTELIWSVPPEGELCQVLLKANIEVGVFSQFASQVSHYHKLATEMYCVLDGEMEIEVDKELFTLKKGDIIVVNPGAIHKVCETKKHFLCRVITANSRGEKDKYCV